MDTEARLKQIEKIAQNARTTWFGLLALLVFVGVTLMGHKDADFFAYGAATQLPLVGIEVPPTAFFYVAPVLTAAVYCYLHVYLIGLWEALGEIEQDHPPGEPRLYNLVYPMLFTLAALWYRSYRREDRSIRPRPLGMWTVIIAIALGWVFGWLVLGFLWWRSMPAHNPWITTIAGLSLWATLDFGMNGLLWARKALSRSMLEIPKRVRTARIVYSAILVLSLVFVSWERSRGGVLVWTATKDPVLISLARADLREAEITRKPKDWLPFEEWIKEYRATYAKREQINVRYAEWSDEEKEKGNKEAMTRWKSLTASLDKISLLGADLRGANLRGAFLSGADLRSARMEGADLSGARMEGANLRRARMEGANLDAARLEGAHLTFANLEDVKIRYARLDGADLRHARATQADFIGASLFFADLRGSDGIVLRRTNLDRANLRNAKIEKLATSDFLAIASSASLVISSDGGLISLRSSTNISLSQQEIDRAFGSSSTKLPAGLVAPCHWDKQTIGPLAEDTKYQTWLDAGAVPIPRNPDGTCPAGSEINK